MNTEYRVAIALTTFRRDDLLPRLIEEIQRQINDRDDGGPMRLLIVDNDPAQSARAVSERFGADYACETRPGIASARQRVLAETADDDVVVMLDDDVIPEPGWLGAILDTWIATRATVVMGYVRWVWPDVDDPTMQKIRAGGFMRRPAVPTGTSQTWLATGNVLIDSRQVQERGLSFDVSLGMSGGEDTLFGRAVISRGGTIVACQESSVMSVIPAERTTLDFARQRAVGQGISLSHLALRRRTGVGRVVASGATAVLAVVRIVCFSAARVGAIVLRNPASEGMYLRKTWTAWGRLRGAIGHVSDEYARTDD